ncbi:hypothetical protein HAZT_HAZT006584 [Hyalella azteca]|uniref:Annexin n=1 Tax=Hyalella azteca TaxID=294128 RepID=A0A6A0GZH1_HYAAZ|nr:hypothetical protein HAZT_HAZT006584 [Hyalella azteca]
MRYGTIKEKANFDDEAAAKRFKLAMKGLGSDEAAIISLLVSHSSLQRQAIEEKYKKMYGRDLVDDLKDELGGHFEDAVVAMMTSPYSLLVDALHSALSDLYDAGIGANAGSEESEFIAILNTRSFAQLNPTFQEYENISQEAIEESIKKEFSGDLMDGLLSIVKRVRDPPGFFAERLHNSIAGSGTDDKTLIRLLVSRSEVSPAPHTAPRIPL